MLDFLLPAGVGPSRLARRSAGTVSIALSTSYEWSTTEPRIPTAGGL